MSSPAVLDLESLLQPIPGDRASGADLREDSAPNSAYYLLKDARSSARAAERALESTDDQTLPSEWRLIAQLAPAVLAETSKDLEVAAWYVEALARLHGFAGLRDGFRLIGGLVERHWAELYPVEDEDGVATKIAPVTGLNGEGADGTLIQPIRKLAITEGVDPGPFATWQYEQAVDIAALPKDKKEARLKNRGVDLTAVAASAKASKPAFFRTLLQDIGAAADAFEAMNQRFDAACGLDGPPASNIRSLLATVLGHVRHLSRDILPPEPAARAEPSAAGDPPPDGDAAPLANGANGAAHPAAAPGQIADREDAFRAILKAAEFFRRAEPHSPISYTLEEVARRGRLELPDLLKELIEDEAIRNVFFMRSGIKPPGA